MAANENLPIVDLLDDSDGFWTTGHDWAAKYEAEMAAQERLIDEAIEKSFVACRREVNFCLNHDIVSRSILAEQLLMTFSNWMADYTYASDSLGAHVDEKTSQENAGKLLAIFGPVYLRVLIASLIDEIPSIAEHISATVPADMELFTEEQEGTIEEFIEWFGSVQKPVDAECKALGFAVARKFAGLICSDDEDDELTAEVDRLDREGLPIFATIGLAASLAASVGQAPKATDMCYDPDEPDMIHIGFEEIPVLSGHPFASDFYKVWDGASDKGTATPSLAAPAGIVDALFYDMEEELIRYIEGIPFRRGYEWNDPKNHIIVPNKSDEVILDHLLREGFLMPFAEHSFWACDRKDSYDTREEARTQADVYEKREPGKRLGVYRCIYCGKYHITHKLGYDTSKDADYEAEFERRLAWHGIHSCDLILHMGMRFLQKHRVRIIRCIRERWNRLYGRGSGGYRRAA